MVHKQISYSNKNKESLVEVHYFVPISSATLSRAGRNARQQASTAKLQGTGVDNINIQE